MSEVCEQHYFDYSGLGKWTCKNCGEQMLTVDFQGYKANPTKKAKTAKQKLAIAEVKIKSLEDRLVIAEQALCEIEFSDELAQHVAANALNEIKETK